MICACDGACHFGGCTMSRFRVFRMKNAMLFANLISNAIGVCVVLYLAHTTGSAPSEEVAQLGRRIDTFFLPFAFLFPVFVTLLYERPIRKYIARRFMSDPPAQGLAEKARQRLLNEPFFAIALDLGLWLTAGVIYPLVFWTFNAGKEVMQRAFILSFFTGLITTTVAFFVFESVLQRKLVPYFFPNGGLYMTPKTIRIRIRTRLTAFLLACNLVPFAAILHNIWGAFHSERGLSQESELLLTNMVDEILIFMGVGIWLTFLVSSNLTRPLHEMIQVLGSVRRGQFETKVRVTSNDEIGYTGDAINEMTEGLKERDFLKETFGKYVTEEVRDEILSGRISLDGELKEVTVLFADLRDFTPMVESTPPKEVVKIINGYFKEMDEAIRHYHGVVLQFIGDEIEAVFGAPLFRADHPIMAVHAALEMQKRLRAVNQDLAERGYPALSHGIGIHTGEVVAANIGSPDRLSYALVGDTVNLASRLQDLNKEFGTQIIMSAATGTRLNGDVKLHPLPPTKIKGKAEIVEIFSLT